MWQIYAVQARDIITERQREADDARRARLASSRRAGRTGSVGRARARLTAATGGAIGR